MCVHELLRLETASKVDCGSCVRVRVFQRVRGRRTEIKSSSHRFCTRFSCVDHGSWRVILTKAFLVWIVDFDFSWAKR